MEKDECGAWVSMLVFEKAVVEKQIHKKNTAVSVRCRRAERGMSIIGSLEGVIKRYKK
ncbi:hypothetical protein GCM10007877_29060 [Marinibactrum halimedae]|uniref:Uncharacterized protein n=1 Tax=Marinibactrum halimedae TaxID=1444977 RepID=A0AA37WQG0_9GAMM|nr:hypothetical protein GCM10007877_29060 [Marinibactrum halimedae]